MSPPPLPPTMECEGRGDGALHPYITICCGLVAQVFSQSVGILVYWQLSSTASVYKEPDNYASTGEHWVHLRYEASVNPATPQSQCNTLPPPNYIM